MTDSSDAIFKEVQGIICNTLAISADTVTPDVHIADLSEDSIQLFELLLAFEKKYNTETTYEDVVSLQTVADIVAYVQKKVYALK